MYLISTVERTPVTERYWLLARFSVRHVPTARFEARKPDYWWNKVSPSNAHHLPRHTNPKSEILNTKQYLMTQIQISKRESVLNFEIRIWDLFRISKLGFRIWLWLFNSDLDLCSLSFEKESALRARTERRGHMWEGRYSRLFQ